MKQLKWMCSVCGMSTGRRTSVQRHIDNPNIHNGNGRAVSFTKLLTRIGRRKISLQSPEISSRSNDTESLTIRIEKEVENQIVKEVARRIYESHPSDDPMFGDLEKLARIYINDKASKGLVKLGKSKDGNL